MAVGTVTKYNQLESVLFSSAGNPWDDATPGNIMFVLAKYTYTPAATHTTMADVGTSGVDWIASGDGAPMNATTLALDDTTTPGTTYYASDDADFGTSVTITAKWLLAVQPVSAGTAASTSKLLWYVDLNDTSSTASASATATSFNVAMPTNGWFKTT